MFRTTEYSAVYQQIVDTYGVPNYKEANPAVPACVTFPFLFGVMFGDVMHGAMLLGFALWICYAGRPGGAGGFAKAAYPLRHFLLAMGFFATYCGFCYNDYSSTPIYTFGDSCYEFTEGKPEAYLKPDCVYPLGVDPVCYMAVQELTFMNSLKMKLSVIFGVAQMSMGIFFKGSNAVYNRSFIDFFFEFVPQIIVLSCLFGYMDLMIIIKWLTDWSGREGTAPAVVSTMIDMFLNMGKPTTLTDDPIFENWEIQTELELTLLSIVGICVPAMLLVKPIYLSLTSSKKHHHDDKKDKLQVKNKDDDFLKVEPTTLDNITELEK